MKLLYPSILDANFMILGQEIRKLELAGADCLHIDVMDGKFVPKITMGSKIVKDIYDFTKLPIDVHLMVEHPDIIIEDFILAGASSISVHQETCSHLHKTILKIKNKGVKAGVALNPSTSLDNIRWILKEIDFVLIMSVNPGFGGQKFIDSSLEKISMLKKMLKDLNLNVGIQIDGGININNINLVSKAGINLFVAGSSILGSNDYFQAINNLKLRM